MNINYAESFNFKPKATITPYNGYWQNGTWKFNMSEINAGAASQPSWIDVILKGNTALTLVNAKENGLNYVKLFGDTEQRILPSEYTQLEYIRSDGLSYLIVPYRVNNKTVFYCRYNEIQNGPQQANAVFGVTSTPNTSKANYGILRLTGNSFDRMAWGDNTDGSTIDVPTAPKEFDTWYEVLYDQNELYQDGTLYATSATPNDTVWSANYDLGIFARNSSSVTMPAVAKISSVWAKEDGEYKINLVPAKRNSDNVLGMYDLVSGQFLTNAGTGSFVAGADAVPTPNAPMDIICNNGVVKYSKNLLDMSAGNIVLGKYINNSGAVSDSPYNFYNSKYISVVAGETYTWSTSSSISYFSVMEYDSNYVFKNRTLFSNAGISGSITLRSDTAFVLIGSNMNGADVTLDIVSAVNWQFELGSTATPYMPYGAIYADGTVETVNAHGKNLFNPATNTDGYRLTDTGTVTSDNNAFYTAHIPVVAGATYTYNQNTGASIILRICEYNSTNALEKLNKYTSSGEQTVTITMSANTSYIIISADKRFVSNPPQLELGSTATEYEPYFIGGTATAEMLLKVGNYQDVQSVIDGAVTRKVGVKVFDGTENFSASGAGWAYGITDKIRSKIDVYCTHYPYSSATMANAPDKSIVAFSSQNIGFKDSSFTSATDVQAFFLQQYNAGTPVIVVYALDEPTTETVTGQLLAIQEGTNIVEITQASMDNLELEVSYKAGVEVTVTEIENAQLDNSVEVTIQ